MSAKQRWKDAEAAEKQMELDLTVARARTRAARAEYFDGLVGRGWSVLEVGPLGDEGLGAVVSKVLADEVAVGVLCEQLGLVLVGVPASKAIAALGRRLAEVLDRSPGTYDGIFVTSGGSVYVRPSARPKIPAGDAP